jgi:uncharacterized protein with von Willebrand factor type A (vWA) domain
MINRIVTARQTEFSNGSFVGGTDIDTTVARIESVFGSETSVSYIVTLSDGSWIEVKDVVEIWQGEG